MLFTLAAVVFFAAIMTFFSQEFLGMFKKIMAIKGAKLVLPLLAASWAVLMYNYWILWGVYYYSKLFNSIIWAVAYIIPFNQFSYPIASILILTIISVVPIICFDYFYYRKKNYKSYPHIYLVSTIIWLVNALIVIVL